MKIDITDLDKIIQLNATLLRRTILSIFFINTPNPITQIQPKLSLTL